LRASRQPLAVDPNCGSPAASSTWWRSSPSPAASSTWWRSSPSPGGELDVVEVLAIAGGEFGPRLAGGARPLVGGELEVLLGRSASRQPLTVDPPRVARRLVVACGELGPRGRWQRARPGGGPRLRPASSTWLAASPRSFWAVRASRQPLTVDPSRIAGGELDLVEVSDRRVSSTWLLGPRGRWWRARPGGASRSPAGGGPRGRRRRARPLPRRCALAVNR